MVIPNWKKNLPIIPFINTTGTKIAKIAIEAASAANVISRAPSIDAFTLLLPISTWRTIFSSTIIASSTTIPITSDKAKSVKVLSVNPKKYIKIKVPKIETGIAKTILIAEESEPINAQHTTDVKIAERIRVKLSS